MLRLKSTLSPSLLLEIFPKTMCEHSPGHRPLDFNVQNAYAHLEPEGKGEATPDIPHTEKANKTDCRPSLQDPESQALCTSLRCGPRVR